MTIQNTDTSDNHSLNSSSDSVNGNLQCLWE